MIKKNYGIVAFQRAYSVIENHGGTVIEYKKVTLDFIGGASAEGLTEENGEQWIEKGGEFIIIPGEGLVFENVPLISGGDIVDNGDGTYTVKNITGDITLEAKAEEPAVEPQPEAKKTQFELFAEVLYLLFTLLAHLLMSL